MSERIREFAKQADRFALDYVQECKHYGYHMEHNEYDIQFEEKFAELIVRECAKVCDDIDSEYDGEVVLATWCAKAIKEHFGVEDE